MKAKDLIEILKNNPEQDVVVGFKHKGMVWMESEIIVKTSVIHDELYEEDFVLIYPIQFQKTFEI